MSDFFKRLGDIIAQIFGAKPAPAPVLPGPDEALLASLAQQLKTSTDHLAAQ